MFGLVLDLEGPSFKRLLQLSATDVGSQALLAHPALIGIVGTSKRCPVAFDLI